MVYFSDIFNLDESILEESGAMNISLLNDIRKHPIKYITNQ